MALSRKQVFELAINALDAEATETYEQSEIDGDPQIQKWIAERHEAIEEIEKLRTKMGKMGLL